MAKLLESLPVGWATCSIGDVIPKPRVKVKPNKNSKLPFIGMDHIEAESFDLIGQDEFKNMKSAGSPFSPDDVLYGRLRPYLNKVHRAKFEGVASAEFIVLPSSETHDSNFIKYLLHHIRFVHYANEKSSGDRPRIKFDRLAEYEFNLPPHAEQERIVDKVDELFSSIEAGERAIGQARAGVARYRKAILKAAVTGELSADWREENPAKESAKDLLSRILTARFEAWEKSELAKLDAKGKARPETEKQCEKFRARYKPPVEPDIEGLPDLPEHWMWASLDCCTTKITSGSRDWKKYYDRGTSVFLMAQNIRPRKLDLTFIQNVDPPEGNSDALRSEVKLDDILITIVGANTGDTCRVAVDLTNHYVCQSVALMRPTLSDLSGFLELFISSGGAAGKQVDSYIYGAGRPHLSFEQLRMLAIPIIPKTEQAEIVNRVEQALSKADAVEATLDAQSRAAKALKQAVLKTAFEGNLVPQNPNDEPASELLKRIKEET